MTTKNIGKCTVALLNKRLKRIPLWIIVFVVMIFVSFILANVYVETIPYHQTLKSSTLVKVPLAMLTSIQQSPPWLGAGVSDFHFQIPVNDFYSEGIEIDANGVIWNPPTSPANWSGYNPTWYNGNLINGTFYTGKIYEMWGHDITENLKGVEFSAYGLERENTYDVFPEHYELRFGKFSDTTFIYCLLAVVVFWLINIQATIEKRKV